MMGSGGSLKNNRSGPFVRTLASQYDANGHRIRIVHPGGHSFVHAQDGLGPNISTSDGPHWFCTVNDSS